MNDKEKKPKTDIKNKTKKSLIRVIRYALCAHTKTCDEIH
jgi:hypothetical protein